MRKFGAVVLTGLFLVVIFSIPITVKAQTATPPTTTPTPYGCPPLTIGAKPRLVVVGVGRLEMYGE